MSGRTMRAIVCDELMAWMDVAAGVVEGQKWTVHWMLVSMCAEWRKKREMCLRIQTGALMCSPSVCTAHV